MRYLVLSIIFALTAPKWGQATLDLIQDVEILELIQRENHLVVLFSTKNCELCDSYENILDSIKEDIKKELNALTFKVMDSQLKRLYNPTKEPILVFFRHGIPLLYNGAVNDEMILHTFINNKEPIVKELTDDTFEHLTQVATGATTGDWFVMFYTSDCVDCNRLIARWETVGAELKTRMNVARVNKATAGAATGKRFNVDTVPSFILFRQGKMFRYKIQKYDIPSFVSFAQEWYKNMKPERVPHPRTPFDEFTDKFILYLQQYPWLWQIGLGVLVISFIIVLLNMRKQSAPKKPQKSQKKKDEGKDK